MVKNFMLDTESLLQNPENIFGFQDNNVWISGTTLQELDMKIAERGEDVRNATETARILDGLRAKGDLKEGVPLGNGGRLFIEADGVKKELLPEGYSLHNPHNRIISTCLFLNGNRCRKSPVILLTNNFSMRINASTCGLRVEKIKNDIIEKTTYTGHIDLGAPVAAVNELYKKGEIEFEPAKGRFVDDAGRPVSKDDMRENEFVTLHTVNRSGDESSALSMYRDGKLRLVREQRMYGGYTPLNRMQKYALYALTAPVEEIPLVILSGKAGTSKTFISLAAGLSQTYMGPGTEDARYRKMLIGRPNSQTTDPGFGYLPGNLEDKMSPLIASYTDNLDVILRGKHGKNEDSSQIRMQIDDLFETGSIELCPLSYIRGRSLMDSYIICDEAQNGTKGLIKDVITRAGRGTKVIVAGDVTQVDNASLDEWNNGLAYCISRLAGRTKYAAYIAFPDTACVRSPLAEAAIQLM